MRPIVSQTKPGAIHSSSHFPGPNGPGTGLGTGTQRTVRRRPREIISTHTSRHRGSLAHRTGG